MKLDLDYIKTILSFMEGHPASRMLLQELIDALAIPLSDDARLDTLAGHLRIMNSSGFIECKDPNCGFAYSLSNDMMINSGTKLVMTMTGYQMLDTLRNDTLMGKIRAYLSEIGSSGIKNAPGFVIGIAVQHILKNVS